MLCVAFDVGENNLMATLDPFYVLQNNLKLKIKWDKIHFFDDETEVNLGYPER